MKNEINLEDVIKFQKNYNGVVSNKEIESKIKDSGIREACLNENINLEFKFNVEVPNTKIYNQLDSHQCNIYAFLKVIKDVLNKNSDFSNIDLSSNYINFFDKLEKTNTLYNELIKCKHLSLEIINQKVNRYIGSYGTFHFCREIVNKYGLVPTCEMPEVNDKYEDALTIELLKNKIKCDALVLIGKRKKERIFIKQELMQEIYTFLAKIYGEPPIYFNFNGENITPVGFKNKYLNKDLNDFVTLTSFSKEQFFNSFSFIPNVYLNDIEKIIHLSSIKIKEAVIKQLKDGISVWMSAEESTTLDYNENILDNKIYDVYKVLNIKKVSKSQRMALDIVNYDHAMCITGALIENNDIKQFRVDNSFGYHGKYRGQIIMTNNFFDDCVLTVIVDKKYLS